uniref:Lipoprotein n=1 Tax=viral metagenome TaxID=1070528 RepID=A0A6M3JRY0_9ZZZZ
MKNIFKIFVLILLLIGCVEKDVGLKTASKPSPSQFVLLVNCKAVVGEASSSCCQYIRPLVISARFDGENIVIDALSDNIRIQSDTDKPHR